jgi:hypothetical protein
MTSRRADYRLRAAATELPSLTALRGIARIILVAYGLGGWRCFVITALLAIGRGALVHRCIDLPVRAARRPLPDRRIAFAAVRRGAEACGD